MRTLIVDDSRLARAELMELLKVHRDITVVAEAGDVQSAVSAIDKGDIELVLLDIHLPDGTGFDVLDKSERTPKVIFTTAYEQHAVRAFEFNALDYLLKPVTPERLADALQKLVRPGLKMPQRAMDQESRIFVRDGERCHFVKLRDIYLVNVDGNYVRIFFGDQKAFLSRSLSYVENRLAGLPFFRANRQQLINLEFVKSIEPAVGDGFEVTLKNGATVEVSRRQAKELKERLEF
ncbi:MAG TPA: LytTR family transcriptional regulator DNA-binding domain-containing protein [Steroidobacteraceae bacterium]|nr:LytTR family transcriptional regulator DNA-binding domain-containing protein [Steroidobacteraceae bacterium]